MTQQEMAAHLLDASHAERNELLNHHASLINFDLARELESIFYDARVSNPARAGSAAAALNDLAGFLNNAEASALADWINGIAALEIEGKAELALAKLDSAAAAFASLDRPRETAATQVT